MKSGPSQLEPRNGYSLIGICLKIDEIWAWPAGTPKWLFFNKNLIENQWNLGLASWSPKNWAGPAWALSHVEEVEVTFA